MSDIGAKGSVQGFDVKTAIDYLQQFNSSWPLLKIHHGAAASITMNATPQTIYTHSLGYPALHFIISAGQYDSTSGIGRGIGIDGTDLAYDGSTSIGGTFSFYYYVCRLPLDQDFTAPFIAGSTASTSGSPDIGFKVTKPGKSITSDDLRDYSLHSATRSLMVHQVDNGGTTNDGVDFVKSAAHDLGYVPHGFAFMRPSTNTAGHSTSRYYTLPPVNAGVASASYVIDALNLDMRADNTIFTSAPTMTAVVLKDPFAKTLTTVTFP